MVANNVFSPVAVAEKRNDILFTSHCRPMEAGKRRPYVAGRNPRNVTLPWANLLCKLEDVFPLLGENTVERSRAKNSGSPWPSGTRGIIT